MELDQGLIFAASFALLFSFFAAKLISLAVSGHPLPPPGSRSRPPNAVSSSEFFSRQPSPPSRTVRCEADAPEGSIEDSGVAECLEQFLGLGVFECGESRAFEFDRGLAFERGEENAEGDNSRAGSATCSSIDFRQSDDAACGLDDCLVAQNEAANTEEGDEIKAEPGSCSSDVQQGGDAVNSGVRGCASGCLFSEATAESNTEEGHRIRLELGSCGFDIPQSEDAVRPGGHSSRGLDCLVTEKEASNTEGGKIGLELGSCSSATQQSEDILKAGGDRSQGLDCLAAQKEAEKAEGGKSGIELGSCNFDLHQSEAADVVAAKSGEDCATVEMDDDWEGIERTDLELAFAEAVTFVGREGLDQQLANVSSDVQMQLYGLHKVAMEGPCYEPQPMALKVSARAKWNAWQKLGNMNPEEAMEQYIALLSDNIHGWMGDKPAGDISEAVLSDAPDPNLPAFLHNQPESPNKSEPELKAGIESDGYSNMDTK